MGQGVRIHTANWLWKSPSWWGRIGSSRDDDKECKGSLIGWVGLPQMGNFRRCSEELTRCEKLGKMEDVHSSVAMRTGGIIEDRRVGLFLGCKCDGISPDNRRKWASLLVVEDWWQCFSNCQTWPIVGYAVTWRDYNYNVVFLNEIK